MSISKSAAAGSDEALVDALRLRIEIPLAGEESIALRFGRGRVYSDALGDIDWSERGEVVFIRQLEAVRTCGEARAICPGIVVSPEGPDNLALSLEANGKPAAKVFQKAMFEQGDMAAMTVSARVRWDSSKTRTDGYRLVGF